MATDVVVVIDQVVVPVAVEDAAPVVIEVGIPGPRGPQGPPGSAGANYLTYPAGATLGGHRVVVLDASQQAIYADHGDVTHAAKVLGITTGAAMIGADATIQPSGPLIEPSWNWTPDLPVFLGAAGQLTQTPPTTGFLIEVGFPISPTELYIDIGEAIIL